MIGLDKYLDHNYHYGGDHNSKTIHIHACNGLDACGHLTRSHVVPQ